MTVKPTYGDSGQLTTLNGTGIRHYQKDGNQVQKNLKGSKGKEILLTRLCVMMDFHDLAIKFEKLAAQSLHNTFLLGSNDEKKYCKVNGTKIMDTCKPLDCD